MMVLILKTCGKTEDPTSKREPKSRNPKSKKSKTQEKSRSKKSKRTKTRILKIYREHIVTLNNLLPI